MAIYGFLGCALIAGGPSAAVYYTFLRRKSFLALLVLACAFAWLVGLLLISALFRAFVPLEAHSGALAAALVVGVAVQEGMRLGAWALHRRLVVALNGVASSMEGTAGVGAGDERLLALAQGWAHGATHTFFFYFSWLPLYTGQATLYLDACPALSYFLAGALLAAAFALLHTCSMVLAFDGLARGRRERWAIVPAAHLVAALLTLANLQRNGCLVAIPLLLLLGLGAAGAAGWVCWEGAEACRRGDHMPVATEEDVPGTSLQGE